MKFLMIVDDSAIARHICAVEGVIPFVDLEYLGKAERQGHIDSWKSSQSAADVTRIREAVPNAHLVVRINPLHEGTPGELDDVIARGADSIMLPMFHTRVELSQFFDLLGDRAEALPLFETADAVRAIPEMVGTLPLTQLHIGLNDLHLDLGKDFIFEPLAEGILEQPAAALRQAGIDFGIGGLARSREGIVSPEFLLGEHVRLGSSATILSRTFHRGAETLDDLKREMDFAAEVEKLQAIYHRFLEMNEEGLEQNRLATIDKIEDVVQLIRKKKEH
jgi:hypothetical protein